MSAELQAWNNGAGIDLEGWVGCSGSFALAIGYASVFSPRFVEFEDYILRDGFSVEALRGFEASHNGDRRGIKWVMNHLHIADIKYLGCPDLTEDKLLVLGETLREIYQAKLAWQFPDRPCAVEFRLPEDRSALHEYQISFWQSSPEHTPT